jgi:hypothetical protein
LNWKIVAGILVSAILLIYLFNKPSKEAKNELPPKPSGDPLSLASKEGETTLGAYFRFLTLLFPPKQAHGF